MKTRIFLLIYTCMLFVVEMQAQLTATTTYYYKEAKTFYENGYTYQCDVSVFDILVTLYNKSNKLTYAKMTFKDGSLLTKDYFDGYVKFLESDTWTKAKCNSILNNAFKVTRMGSGNLIGVTMYISPETGKVIEVDFNFDKNKEFGTIPVSVFREVELELKNNVWFTPTAEGKKLNYLMRSWMHEVK